MPVNHNLFVKRLKKREKSMLIRSYLKKLQKKYPIIRFYFKKAAGKQTQYKYNLYR